MIFQNSEIRSQRSESAFSLVEVTLALGVAAFCLVAVFGLLPTGVNSNKAALEQTTATNLLTAIAADLRATPTTATKSSVFQIPFPAANPSTELLSENGQVVPSAGSARYLLSVWMYPPVPPPGGISRQATPVRLLLTWPAVVTAANAAGSVETVIALDRN